VRLFDLHAESFLLLGPWLVFCFDGKQYDGGKMTLVT
jgi:hypothetical protein